MPLSMAEPDIINSLSLNLTVEDRDTVAELLRYEDDAERERFALAALRIGVLAVRQASGVVDAQSVQQECERFLHLVHDALSDHTKRFSGDLGSMLGKFFDPGSGEFHQRLDRLIRKDGELEILLSRHLNGEGSALARTLEQHIGEQSPLLQMLSPDQKKGVLAALCESVNSVVEQHSKVIVGQFSLDDRQSALSRLVTEISQKNGDLREALTGDLEHVRKEFSLDNEDGALARLVQRVELANKTILLEFSADNEQSALLKLSRLLESTSKNIDTSLSLDDEKSPLSRLRCELLKVIGDLTETNNRFQEHVRTTLEALNARKKEAARSTTHGLDFEDAVGAMLSEDANRMGDSCEPTGTIPGAIQGSKVGDFVVTLSPDSAFPGAKIVIEAKDVKSFTLAKARAEIETARKNRLASVGVFIYSRTNAPANLEPLSRWGQDVFVIWDAEDVATDVYLKAALSIARALVIQKEKERTAQTVCVHEMEVAVNTLTQQVSTMDEILRFSSLVKQNNDKLAKKADDLKTGIETQLDILRTHVAAMQIATP